MPLFPESLKRRFRPEPLIRDLEIRELIQRALTFQESLLKTKAKIAPADFGWYPWDSFGTLWLLEKLLTGRHRFLRALIGSDPVMDVGCGDGDISFFFESLGCRVCAIDHPPTNYNRMRGVDALKTALQSSVRIAAGDLDSDFRLPLRRCGLAVCFGILYHLKNPLGVLEALSARSRYCLLSTAITGFAPDRQTAVSQLPVAFLADRDGLRGDETNYWIFSETGLRTLVDRAGWEVSDWMLVSNPGSILWNTQADERVICLLRSRAHEPVPRSQLAGGWHVLENGAWRWTERRFSVALAPGTRSMTLKCAAPEVLLTPLTLTASVNGLPLATHQLPHAGDYEFVLRIPATDRETLVEFELDRALAPDALDNRERGIIVRAVEL